MKQLSGSAGLCVCRPHSACYFLEVIRPTLPHQEKALMISGSHEICTACRSCPRRFIEPRFRYLIPSPPPFHCPFLLPRPLSSSPPFIEELLPSFSTKCDSLYHFPGTLLSVTLPQSPFLFTPVLHPFYEHQQVPWISHEQNKHPLTHLSYPLFSLCLIFLAKKRKKERKKRKNWHVESMWKAFFLFCFSFDIFHYFHR